MAWYRNHYHCEDCDETWSDEWSCCCDDECPRCGKDFTPMSSDDLHVVIGKFSARYTILASPPTAGHAPDYTPIASSRSKRHAEAIAACLNTHLDLEEFFK